MFSFALITLFIAIFQKNFNKMYNASNMLRHIPNAHL